MFRKGDYVYYTVRGDDYTATVQRVHRDGSVTIEVRHRWTKEDGIKGAYCGFKLRLDYPMAHLRYDA